MSDRHFDGSSTSYRGAPSNRRFVTPAVCVLNVVAVLLALAPGVASAATRLVNGIVVQGSILNEYNRLEGQGRSPQAPAAAEQNDRQGGKFQRFYTGNPRPTVVNNTIYWNSRVDAGRGRQVGGAIYIKWGQLDWENGYLGYPTTSEENAANGGKFNFFEGGSMYWSSAYGAHPVVGQILETWAGNGYERSRYGFPQRDEETFGDGKRQLFQNGEYIEWHPEGFDVDWQGDTYQDDDANNNSDAFVPTCDDQCGADATVKFNGGPIKDTSGATPRNRSAGPAKTATQPGKGSNFCDEIMNNPDLVEGDKFSCVVRPGTADAIAQESKNRAAEAGETAPTSSAPSATPSSPGASESETTTPQQSSTPSTSEDLPTSNAPSSSPATIPSPDTDTSTSSTSIAPAAGPEDGPHVITGFDRPQTTYRTVADSPLPGNPDYCNLADDQFEDGADTDQDTWLGGRMFQCRTKKVELGIGAIIEGKPVTQGFINVREARNISLNWNNTAWDEKLGIRVSYRQVLPGSVAIMKTSRLTWTLGCKYTQAIDCYNNPSGSETTITKTALELENGFVTTSGSKGIVVLPNADARGNSSWDFKAVTPDYTTVDGNSGVSPSIRCDAKAGLRSTQGCAFEYVSPTMDYTQYGSLDEFRAHVQAAQQSGLRGDRTGAQPGLERVVARDRIKRNRRETCGGVTGPRNNGKSCDEYPFASTAQGGNGSALGVAYSGRTFNPQCNVYDTGIKTTNSGTNGYSVCLIDAGQNSRAGALLGWFYAKNRVVAGDEFYVQVSPPPSS